MDMPPNSSKAVLFFAFGLLAAFFMPWVQLFGVGMSGFGLGRIGSYGNCVWTVPILAGATILASFSGKNNRAIGAFSGIIPLVGLLYLLAKIVSDGGGKAVQAAIRAAGQLLSIGAWLTIIFSVAIIIAASARNPVSDDQNR